MRYLPIFRAGMLIAATVVLATATNSNAITALLNEPAVAFVGVNVVPIHEPGILRNRTVVVQGDRIVAIGRPRVAQIPEGAIRIEARGKFLIPGLADMHVHTSYRDEHMLYIGHGVTTIRDMWPRGLGWVRFRDEINRGESFGANMLVAGMALVGPGNEVEPRNFVRTATEARATVQRLVAEGHDFIKVHEGLEAEPYAAAVETARELGIPVVGHIPALVDVQDVLDSGIHRSISHLSRLFRRLGTTGWQDPVSTARMRELARDLRDRGIYNEATLTTLRKLLFFEEMEEHLELPDYRFLPGFTREWWFYWVNRFGTWDNPANREVMLANRQAMVRELHDAGAPILIGTDGGFPFVMPGYAMHQELALHVRAGLKPYDVLRAATLGAAEFVEQEHEFGSVQVGLRADLVVLDGNPLRKIGNTRRIAGVMVRGIWLDAAEIERRMTAVSQIERVGQPAFSPPWYPGH